MAKQKATKADKWILGLAEISARFGVALAEVYDGARIQDSRSGRELGRSLTYICGLYTTHKPHSTKTTHKATQYEKRDIQGFTMALSELNREHGVKLELHSSPVILEDVETLEPLGRLGVAKEGYTVLELQPE